MTRKIIFLYSFVTILTIFLTCCCEEKHRIVGPYQFEAIKLNGTGRQVVQIINFEFSLQFTADVETASLRNSFNLISNSYATSCKTVFKNELIEEDTELYCDKQFLYNNDTIKPNTNLLKIPELKVTTDKGYGSVAIDFRQPFLDKAKISKGFYVFKIKVKTTDDLTIEAENKLYLDF